MLAYAQKPISSQQTPAVKIALSGGIRFGQRHETNEILKLQRTSGNQTVQRLLKGNPDSPNDSPNTTSARHHPGFDFSRIPVHPSTANNVPLEANATAHHKLALGTNLAYIRTHTNEQAGASAHVLATGAADIERAHMESKLYRHAAGPGPMIAPEIVHEVIRGAGRPIPTHVRRDMEALMGHDFADVRVHTDERAGASAEAVGAHAYTVGRHIVFAPGRFDAGSVQGRRLLTHELTHAAGHPPRVPTPSGDLRISTPNEAAERHAVTASEGLNAPAVVPVPAAPTRLFRQPSVLVALTGVRINHDRVTVPPIANLSFRAIKTPANAPGVTLSIVGDDATIAAGTTINNTTGAITVAAGQTGGSAHVEASQNATGPGGSTITTTSPATAPFNFTAIPSGITSTAASLRGNAGFYGGDFTHTFTSPAGGQTALERSHVNEKFLGASGTTLNINGPLGPLHVTVNNPNSAAAGWDLDSSGAMTGPDQVSWSNTFDARPFVANASHPSPNPGLPQALTATQNFRNLTFPSQTYGTAAVASTTHRRAIEDRNNELKAVTSANAVGINEEVVEPYEGPTVFRRCRANPATIPVTAPAPSGGTSPAATTSTITVDKEGQPATPIFSIRPPNLGCTITPGGVLTPGTTSGTVTIRAGNTQNFDETTVTLTPRQVTPSPNPNPAPQP